MLGSGETTSDRKPRRENGGSVFARVCTGRSSHAHLRTTGQHELPSLCNLTDRSRVIVSAVSRWVGRWLGQSNCLLLNYLMECENQRRRVTGSRSAVRAAARSSPAAQGENGPRARNAGQNLIRGR
ncbi:hypothetical protein Q8A67_005782 [Cirrhinus molitorella]|uniref:Uncharacterized protein n=1 Tax=Cirrhinus molitorella TaxID=172907 RepID=A0AA88Q3Y3_9TELE|nr:hypothetical protein Q8A67_005782 [Cirrhinus molitorella]